MIRGKGTKRILTNGTFRTLAHVALSPNESFAVVQMVQMANGVGPHF
jgi:hypothetical protein